MHTYTKCTVKIITIRLVDEEEDNNIIMHTHSIHYWTIYHCFALSRMLDEDVIFQHNSNQSSHEFISRCSHIMLSRTAIYSFMLQSLLPPFYHLPIHSLHIQRADMIMETRFSAVTDISGCSYHYAAEALEKNPKMC